MNTNIENKQLTPEDVKGGFGPRHCQPEPEPANDKNFLPVDDAPNPDAGNPDAGKAKK